MTYKLTYQSALHERPVTREFESKSEAYDAMQEIRDWFDKEEFAKGITWKIRPKVEVGQ